jgi:hypothetical protein
MARYPKAKKAENPNPDAVVVYEGGGRDPEHPFSADSLEKLADESEGEGSWEVDLRNSSSREKGGYPAEDDDGWGYRKDVERYPFKFSKKGAPSGGGYPIEKLWWQKALGFKREVESRYDVRVVRR